MKSIHLLGGAGIAAAVLTLSLALLADSRPGHVQSLSSPSAEVPQDLSATDWAGIRQAHETSRHAVFAVQDGHRAHNPGQHWLARFDGRGVTARPDAGGWEWGLELVRYGFAGRERDVTEPLRVHAAGQRLTYAWDAALDEWFLNDSRGLEHGFTLHARPAQAEEGAPLTFTLSVRGGLRAEVEGSGQDVRFVDGEGAAVVTYSGLTVFDADGEPLSARFESVAAGLLLVIDERGAHYPLTIDPIAQQAYLKASNTGQSDQFGWSVAVSDATAVVGAYGERSDSTGVDGDQDNDNAEQAGAAYLFVRSGTSWSQYAYLKASNTEFLDRFGWSVAVSADTVLVGAPLEDSDATGVNGDQSNNGVIESGATYVFLKEPGPGTSYCFGDGSGTACPCSNPGGAGAGCANSTGSGGVLATDGSADATADDLTFSASNLLTNQPALLFAGLDAVNGGNGITFGDGLRCAGNSVVRLGVRIPDAAGQCTWGPGLGGVGGWAAGDVRRFQGWYRNPSGSPCGTGFNLTNGMEVAFL